jgi:hypothetical protein
VQRLLSYFANNEEKVYKLLGGDKWYAAWPWSGAKPPDSSGATPPPPPSAPAVSDVQILEATVTGTPESDSAGPFVEMKAGDRLYEFGPQRHENGTYDEAVIGPWYNVFARLKPGDRVIVRYTGALSVQSDRTWGSAISIQKLQ